MDRVKLTKHQREEEYLHTAIQTSKQLLEQTIKQIDYALSIATEHRKSSAGDLTAAAELVEQARRRLIRTKLPSLSQ
jgi:hypothetical protein